MNDNIIRKRPNDFFQRLEKDIQDYIYKMVEPYYPDQSLLLFIDSPRVANSIFEHYPETVFRMNKMIQNRFANMAHPFKIDVWSRIIRPPETDIKIDKTQNINDKIELTAFDKNIEKKLPLYGFKDILSIYEEYDVKIQMLGISFYSNVSNQSYTIDSSIKLMKTYLPFWQRKPTNNEQIIEKIKKFLLNISKDFFKHSPHLDGHYLFNYIEGKLWEISPKISISPKWQNLHLSIKDIDFQIHVYHENRWILDCRILDIKSIIREQCYYDGTCNEREVSTKFSNIENIDEDFATYIKDNFGKDLKTIWDYSNRVYDVMEVIRAIIDKKLNGHYKNFYTLHTNFFNKTLQEVKNSNPNKIVWDEKNLEKYNIMMLTTFGAKPIFNLITQTDFVDYDKLNYKAIDALTTIRLWKGNIDGKNFKEMIDLELRKVSPKFSTTSYWNNLYLDIQDIDLKLHVYLDNQWKFDMQINYKKNTIRIFYKCFYEGWCNWQEYPMNLQERLYETF